MKKIFFLSFSILYLFASDFITKAEYNSMLYKNPRGISCMKCHGKNGEGGIVYKYVNNNGKEIVLKAPDIRNVSFKKLRHRLLFDNHYRVMPQYHYLLEKEVKVIYDYLHKGEK